MEATFTVDDDFTGKVGVFSGVTIGDNGTLLAENVSEEAAKRIVSDVKDYNGYDVRFEKDSENDGRGSLYLGNILSQYKLSLTPGELWYNGKMQEVAVKVSRDHEDPLEGTKDCEIVEDSNKATSAGTHTVTVRGINGFAGELTADFEIKRTNLEVEDVTVNETVTYTGNSVGAIDSVKHGENSLEETKDYNVTYENNTDAGTATVTVVGKGNIRARSRRSSPSPGQEHTLRQRLQPSTLPIPLRSSRL